MNVLTINAPVIKSKSPVYFQVIDGVIVLGYTAPQCYYSLFENNRLYKFDQRGQWTYFDDADLSEEFALFISLNLIDYEH